MALKAYEGRFEALFFSMPRPAKAEKSRKLAGGKGMGATS